MWAAFGWPDALRLAEAISTRQKHAASMLPRHEGVDENGKARLPGSRQRSKIARQECESIKLVSLGKTGGSCPSRRMGVRVPWTYDHSTHSYFSTHLPARGNSQRACWGSEFKRTPEGGKHQPSATMARNVVQGHESAPESPGLGNTACGKTCLRTQRAMQRSENTTHPECAQEDSFCQASVSMYYRCTSYVVHLGLIW